MRGARSCVPGPGGGCRRCAQPCAVRGTGGGLNDPHGGADRPQCPLLKREPANPEGLCPKGEGVRPIRQLASSDKGPPSVVGLVGVVDREGLTPSETYPNCPKSSLVFRDRTGFRVSRSRDRKRCQPGIRRRYFHDPSSARPRKQSLWVPGGVWLQS